MSGDGGYNNNNGRGQVDRLEERILALDRLLNARLDSAREQIRDLQNGMDRMRQTLAGIVGERLGDSDRRDDNRAESQLRVLIIGVAVSLVLGIGSIITALVLAFVKHAP